jgi:hypothetical protein
MTGPIGTPDDHDTPKWERIEEKKHIKQNTISKDS